MKGIITILKTTFNYKKGASLIFCVAFMLFFISTVQAQFAQRQIWDGPYDIRMIGAPNLDPVFVNPNQATGVLLADSLIRQSVIRRTGNNLNSNNQYKGGSPFNDYDIPMSAFLCGDPDVGGCVAGLTTTTPNASCPVRYVSTPVRVNRLVSMTYADYDSDVTTYSSSMAQLDISNCSEIEAAYLYWTGMFKNGAALTLADGPTNTFNGVNASTVFNPTATSGYNSIKFKLPGSATYQNVNAPAANIKTTSNKYLCIADVTSLVQGTGGGQFWTANIQSYPNEGGGGSSSGWALVVIFRSPLSPPRRISLWDGLQTVTTSPASFTMTGLQTPSTSNFKSYVGFGALDAEDLATKLMDKGSPSIGMGFQTDNGGTLQSINPFKDDRPPYLIYNNDGFPVVNTDLDPNKNSCNAPIYDATSLKSYDGIASAHITTYDEATDKNGKEIVRLPSNENTLDIDLHHLKLPNGAIAPGATQATITLQTGLSGNSFELFLAYIAIERLQPKLTMQKSSSVSSSATATTFTYKIRVKNEGNDASLGGDTIFDLLDAATDFVPGSFVATRYTSGVSSVVTTTGVDLFATAGDNLKFKLISPIAIKDSIDITFDVSVVPYATNKPLYDPPSCKRTIENTAIVHYRTATSGILEAISNSDDCGIGPETKVLIVDPINLPPGPPISLGTFPACSLATSSIVSVIQQQLITLTATTGATTANILDYDIRDASNVRVQATDLFGTVSGTVTYSAYHNTTSGSCQDRYELNYNCIACPTTSAGADTTVCASPGTVKLNGTFANATSITWTGGGGSYNPDANTKNAIYTPTAAEITTGTLTLTITTTGGDVSCTAASDQMKITFTAVPTANAGASQALCASSSTALTLSGTATPSGTWSVPAGKGTFGAAGTTTTTVLNSTFTPSGTAKTAGGSFFLTLTAPNSGACSALGVISDTMKVTIDLVPTPNAGTDQTVCTSPAPMTVSLTGTMGVGTINNWTKPASVTGTFANANTLSTTFTPSSADSAAGTITLTLNSLANGTCAAVSDNIIVTLKTNLSNAGVSQSKCSNNASTVLAGSVSRFPTSVTGPTGGIWSGGAGTYSGSGATNLTSTYTPTVGEISSGSVILTLTTTGGTCAGGVDTMKITFTNPPTANANISQTICASTGVVTLNGSVTIASGGTWTRYVGGTTTGLASPSVLNTTFTPTNAELSSGGSIILTLTTTGNGGCTAVSDTMKVNIDKAPTANAGIDQSVCATTVNTASVSLSGTAFPSINTWTSTGTGTFGNATTLTTSYTPTVADTTAHSIKLILSTQSNGLCAATKDTTIISFNPTPLVNANTSQTKCANIVNTAGVTLNGTVYNATGGTWARYPSLITTGITSPTSLNSTFTPSAADTASRKVTLVLTSTGNGGCASITDTMTIFFDIVPIAKAGSDKTVCTSTPTFAVNGAAYPGIGTWSKSGTGTFGNATALSTTYTPSSADNLLSTYTLTLTSLPNGTCLAVSDQLIVTVVAPPNPNLAVSDAKICEGSNGTLIITGSEAGKGYQAFDALSGTSMSAVDTSTGGNLSLTIPATNLPYDGTNNPTPYNIVIAVYGCDTTALVDQSTIEVTPVPLANAGTDIQVDDYIPIHLDGSGSSQGAGYTYQWTSSDPSSSTIANPISDTTTVDVQSISLSFTLTVTDVVNTTCKASDVVNIKVQPKPVVIPNAFSPNGDGTHDTFVIQNIKFFKNAVLYIYNQWGELIYKSDPGYKIPWDGTRNGKDVPVSAYYYVLELNLTGFNSLSGDITIIK